MATIQGKIQEKIIPIHQFLGLNQAPNGDTNLKYGEAAAMQNFKITDDYSLQIRPGSRSIANLFDGHTITVSSTASTLFTEINSNTKNYTMYPDVVVNSAGVLVVSGVPAAVNYANRSSYIGYYYADDNGIIHKFSGCVFTRASTGTLVDGGSVSYAASATMFKRITIDALDPNQYMVPMYTDIEIRGGIVVGKGNATKVHILNFFSNSGYVYFYPYNDACYFMQSVQWDMYNDLRDCRFYGYLISPVQNDTYQWNFYDVSVTSSSTDVSIRGIWYGKVASTNYIVAACNSTLWTLTLSSGTWTKMAIGTINTSSGNVHMFGFDSKLYIIDGSSYKVWDGSAINVVTGYRPLVSIANSPSGEGTTLEQINKLTGQRRARFSPDGTATAFHLPEKGLTSIDYVKYVATDAAISYTSNLTDGIATLASAPVAGTNTIEIGWTYPTNYRSQITSMRFSETFNGQTDTRIFLYGDGSNKAYYSGLDTSGVPRADYFPDLNVIAVDKANTPITSMIKHFNQLLAFKADGAFEITYGAITLTDGTTTAAFYTTPLNREIGNTAPGQVVLVKNDPFTLFEGGVYDWRMSSFYAKDERIAKKVSQKVTNTLSKMSLADAVCFDDIINGEYYISQGNDIIVYNYNVEAWYYYTGFEPTCFASVNGELYFGDNFGNICRFSRDYLNDNGTNIVAYWESGSMSFGADYMRKYSPCLWVGIKPEASGVIRVTVQTDRQAQYPDAETVANYTSDVASGFFDFFDLDFSKLSFNVNEKPQMNKIKLKVKKFVYYKLIFSSNSNNTTATVTGSDVRVRYTSDAR